jgi:hypothetical protein
LRSLKDLARLFALNRIHLVVLDFLPGNQTMWIIS